MTGAPSPCRSMHHDRWSAVKASLAHDVRRYIDRTPQTKAAGYDLLHRTSAFATPAVLSVFLYRLAHWQYARGNRRIARALSTLNYFVHKVTVPADSCIGPGWLLPHPQGVTFIGTAGRNLTVLAIAICCPRDGVLASSDGPLLGESVTIGARASVVGPVRIGDHSRVAFNVQLNRDAPAGVTAVSQAMRIRMRPRSEQERAVADAARNEK